MRSADHRGVGHAGFVGALVGVGAEEGALPLDEGGGEAFAAEAVVVGQGGGEAGIGSPDGTS